MQTVAHGRRFPVTADTKVGSVTDLQAVQVARQLVADRGLAVSMDDIAEASGIARRTLFRHVQSRDALLADALNLALDQYETQLVELGKVELPLHQWLPAAVRIAHIANLQAGRGVWELAAAREGQLSEELMRVNMRRAEIRQRTTRELANTAWRISTGDAAAPSDVVDAFALCLSTFATQSMTADFTTNIDALVATTALMLEMFLTQ